MIPIVYFFRLISYLLYICIFIIIISSSNPFCNYNIIDQNDLNHSKYAIIFFLKNTLLIFVFLEISCTIILYNKTKYKTFNFKFTASDDVLCESMRITHFHLKQSSRFKNISTINYFKKIFRKPSEAPLSTAIKYLSASHCSYTPIIVKIIFCGQRKTNPIPARQSGNGVYLSVYLRVTFCKGT